MVNVNSSLTPPNTLDDDSPEQSPSTGDEPAGEGDFPPFDPENAQRLFEQGKAEAEAKPKNPYNISSILKERESHNEQIEQYDFRNPPRQIEDTILMASANSLVDSPDIVKIDQLVSKAQEYAKQNGTTLFDALNKFADESDPDNDEWEAIDLRSSFIQATATYAMSKEKSPNDGVAKGLLVVNEMYAESKDEKVSDAMRVDQMFIKPIVEEYLNSEKPYDGPNAFRDYLKAILEQEREEFENMGKQAPSGAERKIRALEKALQTVEQLSENYEANLANINRTAQAHNRTI